MTDARFRRLAPLSNGFALIPLALFLAVLSTVPAAAQGTPQQRAACEQEARWICSNYIPDVDAITACMVRNRHLLSPRCRAAFGGSKSTSPKRRSRDN
jgi:hypothetical protein